MNRPPGRLARLLRWLGHRHVLPFGLRDRLNRLLLPVGTPTRFEVPFFGLRYRGRLDSFIDWQTYLYGAFAASELFVINRLAGLRQGTALDIGANTGHHTLFLATRYTRVHAFEPLPDNVERIREKLSANPPLPVCLHAVALGDRAACLPYFASKAANTGTGSLVAGFVPENEETPSAEVVVAVGDAEIDAHGICDLAFVKIDTEGFEGPVLAGLAATLERDRPFVQCEISPATAATVRQWQGLAALFPPGYRFFGLKAVPRFDGGLVWAAPDAPLPAGDILAVPSEWQDAVCAALPIMKQGA